MANEEDCECKITLECEYNVHNLGINVDIKPVDSNVNYTHECNESCYPNNITNDKLYKGFYVIKIKPFNY